MRFLKDNMKKYSREIIVILDNLGEIIDISDNIYNLLKFKREELIGKNIRRICECEIIPGENEVFITDGERINALYNIKAMENYNENGEKIGLILSIIKLNGKNNINRRCIVRNIFEEISDIVYSVKVEKDKVNVTYTNSAAERILGYEIDEIYKEGFLSKIIHPKDYEKLINRIRDENDGIWILEIRLKHKNGTYIWMEDLAIPTFNGDDEITSIRGISRCVEKRKDRERELEELIYNDNLTKLKNRNYLDEEIKKLKGRDFSIIIIDIDNLKNLNDTKGHLTGDKLILKAANIIKAVFKDECAKFRIGGDEFMIITKNSSESYIKSKLKELEKEIDRVNKESDIKVSLSKGYSICTSKEDDILDVMGKADFYMYKDKKLKK